MADPLDSGDIQRVTDNVNKVNLWAEGGQTTTTVMGGKNVDSPAKVIADSRLFKPAIAWPASTEITDATQSYLFEDVIYTPRIDLLPFTTGSAFTDDNWSVLNSVPNDLVANAESALARFPLKSNLLTEQGESFFTFQRATIGRYTDRFGRIQSAAIDVARFEEQGLLMEGEAENICLHSEDFTDADWVDVGTPIVTANAGDAPDGTTTADEIEDDTATSREGLEQVFVVASDTNTHSCSVYAKPLSGITSVLLKADYGGGNSGTARFNFTTETLTVLVGSLQATSFVALADGWYRIQIQLANASTAALTFTITLGDTNAETGSILVWGAQVEKLDMVTSYIPTVAAAATREADHLIATASNISPKWNRTILQASTFMLYFDILRPLWTGLPAEPSVLFKFSTGAGQAQNCNLIIDDTGTLGFERAAAALESIDPVINTEHRVAVIIDTDERVSIYIDDALDEQSTEAIDSDDEIPDFFYLGTASSVNSDVLFGHIRDLRIYDRELTSEEIRAL